MPRYQTVSASLRPDQIEQLDALADDEDTDWESRNELIREFVDDGLDDLEELPA